MPNKMRRVRPVPIYCPGEGIAVLTLLVSLILSVQPTFALDRDCDDFLWLEEVEGRRALEWTKSQSQSSQNRLHRSTTYSTIKTEMKAIYATDDKLLVPLIMGTETWNFWQDKTNLRGLLRRTSTESYLKGEPVWETLLDVDALSKLENESWVYRGLTCNQAKTRCYVSLSRGGKDATVIREFDLSTKTFVKEGFFVPEAKTTISWFDNDHVWIATDFGKDSLSESGYPRTLKLWNVNQPLSTAKVVHENSPTDLFVSGVSASHSDTLKHFVSSAPSFFESKTFVFEGTPEKFHLIRLPIPLSSSMAGFYRGQLLIELKKEWQPGQIKFPAGAIVALPADLKDMRQAELVFAPRENMTINGGLTITKDHLYVTVLEDVQGKILEIKRGEKGWESFALELPNVSKFGDLEISSSDVHSNLITFTQATFLERTALYALKQEPEQAIEVQTLQALKNYYDGSKYKVEQRFIPSKDGTKVPYYLIARKDIDLDQENPTILYGYGGFEISLTPTYLDATGVAWLERGGVYAQANIRGGGEYGPKWHQAALLEKRQNAYDDFIAVAEDLIKTGITSPERLGIEGGSNGGLLMGVMLTQRPDLFSAIACHVPLLDMLRYQELLAGASWMGEYGDPRIDEMRAYIRKYSPYQNLKSDTKYPEIFFMTSTKDDRVHPGHARKMAARMQELGHKFYYFENFEGGHAGAADAEQSAEMEALVFTYFYEKLFREPATKLQWE